MPTPSSRTAISTWSRGPRPGCATASAAGRLRAVTVTVPPSGIAWSALSTTFWITCAICPSSASASQRPGSIVQPAHGARPAQRETRGVLDHRAERHALLDGLAPLREREQLVGEVDGEVERLLGLLEHRERAVAPVEGQLRHRDVPEHALEQVVEVVRDPAGERPDRLQLLRLEPLLLQELALRDVRDRLDHRGDTPRGVKDGVRLRLDEQHLPLGVRVPVERRVRLAAREDLPDRALLPCLVARPVRPVRDLVAVPADHVVAGRARPGRSRPCSRSGCGSPGRRR